MTPELFATIAIQILVAAVAFGMWKQTQTFHGERIEKLETEKLDARVFEVEKERFDGAHQSLSRKVSRIDDRVHSLETRR